MKNNHFKSFIIFPILSIFLTFQPLSSDEPPYDNAPYLSEIFIKRHSGDNYDPIPGLDEDQMRSLIQAARLTPSSYNDQPWNFIFCDREKSPEAYSKALSSLQGNDWAGNAPLLVIVVIRTKFLKNGKNNIWAEYDTGAAALSMSLQAADMGLMAHQIGGFDKDAIREQFQLPENCKPLAIIAIGYEDANQSETKPRSRRPVEDNFFQGQWGTSYLH